MAPKASGPRKRLGGRSIRTRILMIGWVPSLSLLLIGVILAGTLAYSAWGLRNANSVVQDSLGSSQSFIPEARRELLLTAAYLADPEGSRTRLDAQRARTDQALATIQADAGDLADSAPPELDPVFASFGAKLAEMPEMRAKTDNREASVLDASEYWGSMISQIGETVRALARVAPNGNASVEEKTAADMIELIRLLAVGNGLANVAFSNEGLSDEEFQSFIKTGGAYRDELEAIAGSLPAGEQQKIRELTTSESWREQGRIEQAVLDSDVLTLRERKEMSGSGSDDSAVPDETATDTDAETDAAALPSGALRLTDTPATRAQLNNGKLKADLPIPSSAWETANDEVTQKLTDIALIQLDYSSTLAVDAASTRVNQAVYGGAAAIVFGIVVFLLTTRESNRLAGRLRGLRDETLDLAQNRLPALVNGLRTGEVDEETRRMPKLSFGKDEIGEVADAFNLAQNVAVSAAVQEAETRAGLREVFLNIAYRSQVIVHRQLGVLEKAERFEEDPEQIELLFELDHLATRARRNAENLVILGGGQPGRRWRNSVDLLQVVRSSISEAQDYARVSIGRLPRLQISGAAVADVIHLLAELVDNATSFSPPMSKVEVRGNLVGRGLVLEIEDQGLGVPADKLAELNEMLTTAPDFHALTLREEPRLGMFVVAQLAAGQNIRVTLTPSPAYGGTKAVVLIPAELFDSGAGSLTGATPALTVGDDGEAPVVSGPAVRSLHERMAITGEMTGEITVIPSSEVPDGRRSAAPVLSMAPSEPMTPPATPLERIGRRDARIGDRPQRGDAFGRGVAEPAAQRPEPAPQPESAQPAQPPSASYPNQAPGLRRDLPQNPGEPGPIVNPQARAEFLASRGVPGTGGLPLRTPGVPQNGNGNGHSNGNGIANGAPTPPAGLRSGPPAARPSGTPGRPELPKRTRQSHLSDRLRSTPDPVSAAAAERPEDTGPRVDPDAARNRMAAFQRGTQRGRTERPDGSV